MDVKKLDFSRKGTVIVERYSMNQLVYIARCMKIGKPFRHLLKQSSANAKPEDSTTDLSKPAEVERSSQLPATQDADRIRAKTGATRPSSRRPKAPNHFITTCPSSPYAAGEPANETAKSVIHPVLKEPAVSSGLPAAESLVEVCLDNESTRTDVDVKFATVFNAPDLRGPDEGESGEKRNANGTLTSSTPECTVNIEAPSKTAEVTGRISGDASHFIATDTISTWTHSDEAIPTVGLSKAPTCRQTPTAPQLTVTTAFDVEDGDVSREATSASIASAKCPVPANQLRPSTSSQTAGRGSASGPASAHPNAKSSVENDEAWHVIETVLRSLVNSVLVEEEESVARKRGLHSARNPFASAGLQKYLQTNRDLKMTFLGLAAPSLDAAMNPKKEVISIRATEDVLLRGAGNSSILRNASIAAATPAAAAAAAVSATTSSPTRISTTLTSATSRPSVTASQTTALATMVSVPAEVDKSSPRSRVVSPIRIKVPVGSIRPPTPVKFQRSVPKVDTPLVVVHEQIRKKSPVKENLRHVHRSSAHLNDLDFACGNPPRRSKMHRIKTTTGSSAAPPAATTAPKEPETFSCGEDSIVLHTSDARRCPSWCDEKASRLLRQSLLVLERGRRISVTRYKPDFVSLSLTVNSVVYSASAIITSDELVHQQQKREAQLLHNEAKDGKENNNGRVRSEEGPSGHSPPVDVGWGRGEDASINSVSSAPDQKTTILANKQLPDATTALASSPATNPTTRRGRTVKRNSRLADYLVGERMLKKCEEQAEQQARERNRRVEIEYARQWHEIRSQLTGATPNASNGTTNQQQKEPGQTVPLTTSARSGCYAVPGSIESFSSSDLDHDAEDQDGGAAYGRNKDRGANVTVCDEESSHDRSVDEPYDLDGGLEDVLERVVLPQEGDDQSEEEYGVYPGITTASQEDYGDTIAPVSFPLELHESRQLEKSVSSVFCAGEEAERVKGHESAPELNASQRRMGSKRVVDDHSIMRRMLMDVPCRTVPKERKERRVIVDPRVEDVTAEEIKILEEINDLLYDDPGVVTADQLLFDFRKSFCIEVRNQIQLLRYKKLLLQRNSQLKLALSHAMATLPMHTASSGGPSTSKKPTNTLVGNAPRTVSEGVFKVPFAPGVKPLVTSRQQQQQRQRQTLVRPTQMPAVVSPVRRAALAGSPGRTHINPARVGLASRRQLLAKRANPMTGSEVNGYHFLKFNVRPRLTPSRSHFISSASPSAPKDSANSLDSEASEVLCPSVRAASLREVGRPGGAVRPVCSPPQRSPPSLTVHPPSPQFTNVSGSGCATSLPQVVPVSPIIPSEQLHMLMQPPTGRLVSVEAKKPTDEMFVTDVDRSGLPWTSGSSLPAPGAPKASDVAGVALQQSTSYAMHPMVTAAVEAPLHIHRPRIIKKFVRVKRTVPLFNTGSGPPAAVGVQTRPGSPVQLFRIVSPPRHLPLVRSSGPVASIAGHRVMAPLTRYAVQNVTPQLSGLVNGEGQTDNSFREGIVAFTEEDGSTVTKTLSGPDGSVICLRDGLTSMNESVGPLTENSALDGQDGATPQALQSATDTTVTSALPSKVAVVRGFRPLRTVVRCPQVVSTKRVRALSMANPMKFASPRRHFRLVGPASFTSAVGTSAGVVAKACGQKVTILSAPKVSVVRSSPPAVITIADDA